MLNLVEYGHKRDTETDRQTDRLRQTTSEEDEEREK